MEVEHQLWAVVLRYDLNIDPPFRSASTVSRAPFDLEPVNSETHEDTFSRNAEQ